MNFLVIIGGIGFIGLVVLAIGVAIHYSKIEKQIKSGAIPDNKQTSTILKDAKDKVNAIKRQGIRETDIKIKNAIADIGQQSELIIREIRRDPTDVKKARKFLHYYLDATSKVLEQYSLLKGKAIEGHNTVLDKVLPLLQDIKKGLDYEYKKLFDKELMDLDVEIEVLKKTLEQDINNQ